MIAEGPQRCNPYTHPHKLCRRGDVTCTLIFMYFTGWSLSQESAGERGVHRSQSITGHTSVTHTLTLGGNEEPPVKLMGMDGKSSGGSEEV